LVDFLSGHRQDDDPNNQHHTTADFEQLAAILGNLNDSPVVQQMIEQLTSEGQHADAHQGVPPFFLDSLDRIPKKNLKSSDECPICATNYLEDEYPLVVRLPCNRLHHFDLECIGAWLKLNSTCPLCRKNLVQRKEQMEDSEEEFDDTYG
jgi:Ring finger domain